MCTTIGIIDHGQMMVKGTVDEIMTRLNTSNPLQIRIVEGMDQAVKQVLDNLRSPRREDVNQRFP